MPEGDTVFRTARALHRAFAGRQLTAADLRVPQLATVDLAGATVLSSASRGKHLLLRLQQLGEQPPMTLHSHLGMDGSWRVHAVGERWRARSQHLVRAVLRTADAVAVGYQLRELTLVATADEKSLLAHLGPDLLDADFDAAEAVRRLSGHPSDAIADALRDQRNMAGLGNVYCAEVLFLRGIWPWTPVGGAGDLAGLVRLARRLLQANQQRPVRSTTGSVRRGETLYVYGRGGASCRRCATPIEVDEQGGRVAYWCPSCQPAR